MSSSSSTSLTKAQKRHQRRDHKRLVHRRISFAELATECIQCNYVAILRDIIKDKKYTPSDLDLCHVKSPEMFNMLLCHGAKPTQYVYQYGNAICRNIMIVLQHKRNIK